MPLVLYGRPHKAAYPGSRNDHYTSTDPRGRSNNTLELNPQYYSILIDVDIFIFVSKLVKMA